MRLRCGWIVLACAALVRAEDGPPPPLDDFGLYEPFRKAAQQKTLQARVRQLEGHLSGLFNECPKCRGTGKTEEIIRKRYFDNRLKKWVPARKVTRRCNQCNGDRLLFQTSVADKYIDLALSPALAKHRKSDSIRSRWRSRLRGLRSRYRHASHPVYDVSLRHAVVTSRGGGVYPLKFKLHKVEGRRVWWVHEPDLDGPFEHRKDHPAVPAKAKKFTVWAADVLQLEDGTVVRACGVVIPDRRGAVPAEARAPDEAARDQVRAWLEGKTLRFTPDDYSNASLDGHAIAFVEYDDGKDLGEELLRRGLARAHPKHVHMRKQAYAKAEAAARAAGRGFWGKLEALPPK